MSALEPTYLPVDEGKPNQALHSDAVNRASERNHLLALKNEGYSMSRAIFPTTTSVLSTTALSEFLSQRYACCRKNLCHYFRSGLNNTYFVETADAGYYLRLYRHSWRTRDEIGAEVDLLKYLAANGISVSTPVPDTNGRLIQQVQAAEGLCYMVLFTAAQGNNPKMDHRKSLQYGKLVARIHKVTDRYPRDSRRFELNCEHLIDAPLLAIESFLNHTREPDAEYLMDVGGALKKKVLSRLSAKGPEFGVCHGDHHGGNVHLDKDGNMTLFDFDCYGYGYRSYDIAVFLWCRTGFSDWSAKTKCKRTRLWRSFLDGYMEVRNLTDTELQCAYDFVPIRHIWLMGLHMTGSDTWGRHWINDDYVKNNVDFIRRWIQTYRIL